MRLSAGRGKWFWAVLGSALVGLLSPPTQGQEEDPLMAAWNAFAQERSGECVGPKGELAKPIPIEAGRHRYRLEGHRLVQLSRDEDEVLRIGVISAIKDERDATMGAVKRAVADLKKRRIDVLVVNGDIAEASINADEVIFSDPGGQRRADGRSRRQYRDLWMVQSNGNPGVSPAPKSDQRELGPSDRAGRRHSVIRCPAIMTAASRTRAGLRSTTRTTFGVSGECCGRGRARASWFRTGRPA